jgi:antitoxin component of RelBE/YafQ-DinJ toxin-antitoxin module
MPVQPETERAHPSTAIKLLLQMLFRDQRLPINQLAAP